MKNKEIRNARNTQTKPEINVREMGEFTTGICKVVESY